MGQKINPIGFRLAVNRNWSSRWYANSRSFAPMLAEDIKVRDFLKRKLAHASVGRVLIERPAKEDRKSTRLNSSHSQISYAVFCLKKKKKEQSTKEVKLNNNTPTRTT